MLRCADRGAGFANAVPASLPPLLVDTQRTLSAAGGSVRDASSTTSAHTGTIAPFCKLHRPPRATQQNTAGVAAVADFKENFAVGVPRRSACASAVGIADARRSPLLPTEHNSTAAAARSETATTYAARASRCPQATALRSSPSRPHLASACGGHSERPRDKTVRARARAGVRCSLQGEDVLYATPGSTTSSTAAQPREQADAAFVRMAASMENLGFGAGQPDVLATGLASGGFGGLEQDHYLPGMYLRQ